MHIRAWAALAIIAPAWTARALTFNTGNVENVIAAYEFSISPAGRPAANTTTLFAGDVGDLSVADGRIVFVGFDDLAVDIDRWVRACGPARCSALVFYHEASAGTLLQTAVELAAWQYRTTTRVSIPLLAISNGNLGGLRNDPTRSSTYPLANSGTLLAPLSPAPSSRSSMASQRWCTPRPSPSSCSRSPAS